MIASKSKKLIALVAALLSLFMLVSLCAVNVAADTSADTTETADVESNAETGDETGDETGGETKAESTGESGTESGAESKPAESKPAESKPAESKPAESETEAVAEKDNTSKIRGIINLGIGALILVILAILAIKFRAKIPGWWKALKSECGKISWCSKDKLKKNTFVVVIIIVAVTAAIFVLDFVFTNGVELLIDLF